MQHLLDGQVGNFEELPSYFPIWRAAPINDGVLGIIAVEHDDVGSGNLRGVVHLEAIEVLMLRMKVPQPTSHVERISSHVHEVPLQAIACT